MKTTTDKIWIRRPGRKGTAQHGKPCCGTLNYMAECRGIIKQAEPGRGRPRPEIVNQSVRNYPAVV